MPPVNPPLPSKIIASRSGTAYSTRQAWLISQLTSISDGLSPIRHPGTRLAGDGRPIQGFHYLKDENGKSTCFHEQAFQAIFSVLVWVVPTVVSGVPITRIAVNVFCIFAIARTTDKVCILLQVCQVHQMLTGLHAFLVPLYTRQCAYGLLRRKFALLFSTRGH